MNLVIDWQPLLFWAGAASLLALLCTIVAVPWLVTRLPPDYFARERRFVWRELATEPVLAVAVGLLKNLLGVLLLVLGLVMLVTPGQGVLTVLAGLLLMNFPGKYQLERWLVLRPGVLRGLNWLRGRQNQPPFDTPAD